MKEAPESPKSQGHNEFHTDMLEANEENEKMKIMFKEFYAAQAKKKLKPEVSYINVY